MSLLNELNADDLNDKFFEYIQNGNNAEEAANFIFENMVEDVTMGYMFEFHHGLKTGLTELLEGEREDEEPFVIVNSADSDVFGVSIAKKTADSNCACPNCERPVSATRFAPHLEKCMGMGRNSSRIASRRIASNSREPASYLGLLSDDDDDADWSGDRRKKKMKSNGVKKSRLHKPIKYPQHTDEQRRALRIETDLPVTPVADDAGSPPDSSPSSSCSSSSRKRDRHRGGKSKSKREHVSPGNRD